MIDKSDAFDFFEVFRFNRIIMSIKNTSPQNPLTTSLMRSLLTPIERFMHLEASSGIVLLIVTIVTLFWANSSWHESYEHLIHTEVGIKLGHWELMKSLHHWVNDGLMAIFFFVVGMEIKRELVVGDLSSPKRAALPLFAALGGMIVPALIYTFLNINGGAISGWGIPMATDIAFALGLLALMAKQAPMALRVFLLALAIVDDLGAVLVIAFFYTEQIHSQALVMATGSLALIFLFYVSGVRRSMIYIFLGILAWFFVLKSGVHATVAGVVLGLFVPTRSLYKKKLAPKKMKELVDAIDKEVEAVAAENQVALSQAAHQQVHQLHHLVAGIDSPLDKAIHLLHPWVSFVIMPIFALVNAGVAIGNIHFGDFIMHPVSLGVTFGLLIGKPVGITFFSWLACKMKLAVLPKGVHWGHILAAGFLGGIGFTMALFISNLALENMQDGTLSKLGILIGSLLSGTLGVLCLILTSKKESALSMRKLISKKE